MVCQEKNTILTRLINFFYKKINSGQADSRQRQVTLRAAALNQFIFQNGKTKSVQEQVAAVMAIGFLPVIAGHIPGVDIVESDFPADFPGLLQGLDRCNRQVG